MSAELFVHYGDHRGLLTTVEAKIGTERLPWPIELYDIGSDTEIGVKYPDNACQAQPLSWWPEIEKKLAAHRQEHPLEDSRPRIHRKAEGDNNRPRIRRSK